MSSVLITGGFGALGRALATWLRTLGHQVTCGTRRVSDEPGTAQMNLADTAQLQSVIAALQPEVVFHLAATFSPDLEEAYTVNVRGAINLLEAMTLAGSSARMVLAGSAAEYGVVSPEENPVRENRVLHPATTYGLTKAWQTTWGLMRAHQGDNIVVARIFNLWGEGLSERLFAGRIDQQVRKVLDGRQRRIEVGPLSALRDYISLDEAAHQVTAIAFAGEAGRVYHVASGQPVCMRDLLVKRLAQDNLGFEIVDEDPGHSNRVGYDVPVIYADISATRRLLSQPNQ